MQPHTDTRFPSLPSWLALFAVILGTAGCQSDGAEASTMDKTGSETHWLSVCDSDEQCGALACLCGLCSRKCAGDSECGGGTECIAVGEPSYAAACDAFSPRPRALCLESTQSDGCEDGGCEPSDDDVPAPGKVPATRGGSGSGGGSGAAAPSGSGAASSSAGAGGTSPSAPSPAPSGGGGASMGGGTTVAPAPDPTVPGSAGASATPTPVNPMVGEPCVDGDGSTEPLMTAPVEPEIGVASSATGVNGTFDDYCDADGNLVEQRCEVMAYCGSNGVTDACIPYFDYFTGQVVEQPVDCLGTCVDGACTLPCPSLGDLVTVTDLDTANQLFIIDPGNGAPADYQCERVTSCVGMQYNTPYAITEVASACDTGDCACGVSVPEFTIENGCAFRCTYRDPSTPPPPCANVIDGLGTYAAPSCENGGVDWDPGSISCTIENDRVLVSGAVCETCDANVALYQTGIYYTDCRICDWEGGGARDQGIALDPSMCLDVSESRALGGALDPECFIVHAVAVVDDGGGDSAAFPASGKPVCRCDVASGQCEPCTEQTCAGG